MALSLTSEFSLLDISGVTTLKKGAVFLLHGNGPDIVIKKEEIQQKNAAHFELNRKAMGVIDKKVKASHMLSQREIAALTSFIASERHQMGLWIQGRLPGATEDLETALKCITSLGAGSQMVWYKMPLVAVNDLQSAWNAKAGLTNAHKDDSQAIQQSDEPMRRFLKTLRAPDGLESLGEVLAVYAFSGNKDRCNPVRYKNQGGSSVKFTGHQDFRLRYVKNVGNLMILEKNKARTITGMDFCDNSSMLLHAEKSLTEQTQFDGTSDMSGSEFWGRNIAEPAKRQKFAEGVVADLETIFNSFGGHGMKRKDFWGRTSSDQSALGSNAAQRLEKGMIKGARKLVKYIEERETKKTYPPSFLERKAIYKAI